MNCREEFEKWYSNNDPDCPSIIRNADGNYRLMQAHSAYETWFACWQHLNPPIVCDNGYNLMDNSWEAEARKLSTQTLSESDTLWTPAQWYKKMIAAWHE